MRTKLALCLLSLVILFMALEVGIRIVDLKEGRSFFSDHANRVAKPIGPPLPFRTFGFVPYASRNGVRYISSRHGELFSIEKPDAAIRIVAFGGSTTANAKAVQRNEIHYPLLLQSELRRRLGRENIEVINVGNEGYATPHSLILLSLDVLSWDPDLVILSHNGNDLTAAYWPGFTYDYSNKYSDPFYSGESLRERFTLANLLFQHSRLYWFVKSRTDRRPKRQLGTGLRRIRPCFDIGRGEGASIGSAHRPLRTIPRPKWRPPATPSRSSTSSTT